jgi:DNA adenine methylase
MVRDHSKVAHVRYVSPLRYPGGKAKLAPLVRELITLNALMGGTYVEPYAGGASVALGLLLGGAVSRVHINDIDASVHAFWHSVLTRTDDLCDRISRCRVSPAEWRRQREVHRSATEHDLLDLGFAAFFLNRTNRSGIIASGGIIGGQHQRGRWKIDARFNKPELIRRIERIAVRANSISLHNEDAAAFLRRLLPTLPNKSFVYLDPPYYVKGTQRLYANFYNHDDHAQIAQLIARARVPWLVSYDDRPEIRTLYSKFRQAKHRLTYTARQRYEGRELLCFSKGLSIPGTQGRIALGRSKPKVDRNL